MTREQDSSNKFVNKFVDVVDCNPFYYTLAYAGQLGFGLFTKIDKKVTKSTGKSVG